LSYKKVTKRSYGTSSCCHTSYGREMDSSK
jgi:hypothetical protein